MIRINICHLNRLFLILIVPVSLALSLVVPLALAAPEATFTVTTVADTNDGLCDADCSLREALEAANNTSGEDIITFDAAVTGVITLTGELPVVIESVAIVGPGADVLTVNANSTGRVFAFDSPGDNQAFALSGLTLSGGLADLAGGVMLEAGDSLTINNGNIQDNTASPDSGGGIANLGGMLVISNTLVANNIATSSGAGILNTGVLTISHSQFLTNVTGAASGGIFNAGRATLSNVIIAGNESTLDGGGILNSFSGHISINNSTIGNNTTNSDGGGIRNQGVMTITNSTVSGNTADSFGGGISLSSVATTLSLNNVTITGNTAVSGGGGGVVTTGGLVSLRNTIVAENNAGGLGPDCTGQLTSLGNNLIGNGDFCAFAAATGDLVGFGGGEIDPQLGPLAFNGGSTPTHALSPNSPAIDQGNPAGCVDAGGQLLAADQRGEVRPTDGDGDGDSRCDMGAFEAAPLSGNNSIYLPLMLF